MPSRSKIFSLPRLRGRSRSAARPAGSTNSSKAGRRRLEDDDEEGGNDQQQQRPEGATTLSPASSSSSSAAALSASRSVGRAVSPTSLGSAGAAASGGGYADKSPTPDRAGNNLNGSDDTPTTEGTNTPNASLNYARGDASYEAPLTPASLARETTDESYDDEFTSAFTRSPPSFDKFDSDILSEGGVFPQATNNGSGNVTNGGPIHYRMDPSRVDGYGGEADEGSSALVYSQDESADPPVILMLDDDDDDDEHARFEGGDIARNGRLGTVSNDAGGHDDRDAVKSDWFDPPSFRGGKNRRLVSPDPSPAKEQLESNDDLSAWGELPTVQSSKSGFEGEDVFGTNFFTSFDGDNETGNDDGFGEVTRGDNGGAVPFYFGNDWMDVGNSDRGVKSKEVQQQEKGFGGGSCANGSDPWGETSFVSASFNYSLSNEDSVVRKPSHQALEEKKDDEFHAMSRDDPPAAAAAPQAALVWDSQASTDAPASHPLRQHPLKTQSQLIKSRHEQQQQQQQQQQQETTSRSQHEVLVTFDNSVARPPSMIDERKPSENVAMPSHHRHVSANTIPAHRGGSHRRLNSNGSQSSRKSQLSHSQRRHKKGGGSVGSNRSNSSAVDQILEHYRQKRRGNLAAAHGGSSVHSGSQFSNSGSSPGSNAPGGPGTAGTVGTGNSAGVRSTVVARSGSGGSGHRRNPSSESASRIAPNHRRNPSNESVSRIIENLESTAAVVPPANRAGATAHRRTPSPVIGKYYPPNGQNGYVGSQPALGVGVEGQADDAADNQFLLANIEATIGPRGAAPDMESLSGARGHRPQSRQGNARSRPHRSPTRGGGRRSADRSVDSRASRASRASRNSFRTYQSTRSALTTMSKETQSVANDLFRLEAQLAEQVARQQREEEEEGHAGEQRKGSGGSISAATSSLENVTHSTSGEFDDNDASGDSKLGAEPAPRGPSPFAVVAPPGKLGILLSNSRSSRRRAGGGPSGPTHVSAVRSESVLAGKVHVGDVFVSIDGEDVTHLNSKEITSVMARKSEFERVLRFRPLASGSAARDEWI